MTTFSDYDTKYQLQTDELPLLVLPQMVCFPGILLPVYLSTTAETQLIRDAQQECNLLVIANYRDGWQSTAMDEYPQLNKAVCLCKIVSASETSSGSMFLLLEGLLRAKLVEELPTGKLYRVGSVQVVTNTNSQNSSFNQDDRKQELWELYQLLFSEKEIDNVLNSTVNLFLPLSSLVDLLSASLTLPHSISSTLLAEDDVELRCDLLIQHMRELLVQRVSPTSLNTFPPAFSGN